MNEPCELLEWDTHFFARHIARVVGHQLDERTTDEVLDWCRRHRIECLYFLADAHHPETTTRAEALGFGMKDMRLTYARRLPQTLPALDGPPPGGVTLRPARAEDCPALEALVQDSFTQSRFYFDERFPRPAVSQMYKLWVRQSVLGRADQMLVLESVGRAAGFITCCLLDDRQGQCSLTCLEESLRGRGLGAYLLDGALRWFARQGVETVRYVTQGRNIAAQRLIQKLGFLTHSVQIWYHKWFEEPALFENYRSV